MNYSTMAFLASDDIIAVSCVFASNPEQPWSEGKEYTYKTTMKDLKKDDLVIVQCTGPSNFFGYCVVKVVRVDIEVDFSEDINYKWIVSKLDIDEFKDTLKAEKELIANVKRMERKAKRESLANALGLNADKLLGLAHFKNDGFKVQEAPPPAPSVDEDDKDDFDF